MSLKDEITRRVAKKLDARANDCPQEMCQNWTGQGCACKVYDLEPVILEDDE